ncbi:MAG: hypothetical protein AAGE84_31025 [Cyanobacteria bacterium P01_G01_bin.39]
MPDEECRYRIWQNHLPEKLPLAADVSGASHFGRKTEEVER